MYPSHMLDALIEQMVAMTQNHDAVEITGGEPLREHMFGELIDRIGKAKINLLTAGSMNRKDCESLSHLKPGDHVLLTNHITERNNKKSVINVLNQLPSGVDATVKVLGNDIETVSETMKEWNDVRVIPGLIGLSPGTIFPSWPNDFPDWLSVDVNFSDGSSVTIPPDRAIYEGFTRIKGWRCAVGNVVNELGDVSKGWCKANKKGVCTAHLCGCEQDLRSGRKQDNNEMKF